MRWRDTGEADLIRLDAAGTAAAIAPLPVAALRREPSALKAARKFGFKRIVDLFPVAHGPLARRPVVAAMI